MHNVISYNIIYANFTKLFFLAIATKGLGKLQCQLYHL